MKNKDLLLNGLNKIVSELLSGDSPTLQPGAHAWKWFSSTKGPQFFDVNTYVASRVDGKTVTETTFTPTKNWDLWSVVTYANFANATGDVATWLEANYPMTAADVPTVPDDVITWTRANLALVGTNKDLLIHGLNQIINDLVTGPAPTVDPAKKAYEWLKTTYGAQPAEVNTYIAGKLSTTSTRALAVDAPSTNWGFWMTIMNGVFDAAPAGSVADWLYLSTRYTKRTYDVPTAPDDVITWTKIALPTVATAAEEGEVEARIEVKMGTPSRVGR